MQRKIIGIRIGLSMFSCLTAGSPFAADTPAAKTRPAHTLSFAVSFPAARSTAALDGRVILLLSRDLTREPRSHVEENEALVSPYLFGLNVDGLAPGKAVVVDDKAFGWPVRQLSKLPSGDYQVQAVLNSELQKSGVKLGLENAITQLFLSPNNKTNANINGLILDSNGLEISWSK